ncbi:MAG: quinone-dependent dihydroorotate dehydrogenase [Gammaproteobacteria bacterium WSBS_2016_MAG_OTU1]
MLFSLPPEAAHNAAVAALRLAATCRPPSQPPQVHSKTVMGLSFANPLGLAAGFDKNADATDAMATLGFGFIEVGAITPIAQAGNPSPRIFRLPEASALINRMGFNNCGMEAAKRNLSNRRGSYIVGINLGKNAKTPIENAAADYEACLKTLYNCGDFFTINISSPNTPNLQSLQTPSMLRELLKTIVEQRDKLANEFNIRKPLAVKLSSDLSTEDISAIAEVITAADIDGVIAVNTTQERPPEVAALSSANEAGGLSGAPLTQRALEITRQLRELLPQKIALIGVGGIMNAEDAKARLDAGADLLQMYTGLIYGGPCLPRQILSAI